MFMSLLRREAFTCFDKWYAVIAKRLDDEMGL